MPKLSVFQHTEKVGDHCHTGTGAVSRTADVEECLLKVTFLPLTLQNIDSFYELFTCDQYLSFAFLSITQLKQFIQPVPIYHQKLELPIFLQAIARAHTAGVTIMFLYDSEQVDRSSLRRLTSKQTRDRFDFKNKICNFQLSLLSIVRHRTYTSLSLLLPAQFSGELATLSREVSSTSWGQIME